MLISLPAVRRIQRERTLWSAVNPPAARAQLCQERHKQNRSHHPVCGVEEVVHDASHTHIHHVAEALRISVIINESKQQPTQARL